jgi:aspartyl-tRNA(Asn)/glutamyl-tRNA(Gln) amidotransferase subunit A
VHAGKDFPAADYIELGYARQVAIDDTRALLRPFDAMIYPTVAVTAPTIAEADASDEAYGKINLLLLRNTGCAPSV